MSSAPSAQFRPTLKGRTCAIEIQKASTVWPDSVRPLRSVIVTDSITGMSTPRRSNTLRTATAAALAFRVSKMVSTSSTSTPPSSRPSTWVS